MEITPKKLLREIDNSRLRLAPFRKARYQFLRAFVGQYYNTNKWNQGDEPLNLIFNAIRVLVPNLVMNYPKVVISTKDLSQRQYAELLGLGLDDLAQTIQLKKTLRRWVVDSLFGLATIKVGLCTRETIRETDDADPTMVLTQPYADNVDFDDLILDPFCRRREESAMVGNHILVDRTLLLDSGLYDNAVIERLPSVLETLPKREARSLSQQPDAGDIANRLQTLVNVAETWIPSEGAIFTMPGHLNAGSDGDKYLCEPQEAYCLNEGPYVFLSVTPDVPDNPLPVAPVSIWHDLHIRANEMLSKMIEQASSQKDIALFKRGMEDDADMIRTSQNLDVLGVDDPNLFQKMSLGGQNPNNERMLGQLMMLFSQMAGNIEQLAGNRSDADSATQATILQQNGMVSVEDMRDLVYDGTAEIYRRLGWYLHTDPLIDIPLIRRSKDENGQVVEEPVRLTPEVQAGEYFNFMFKIKLKSMSRLDPQTRIQRMMQLFTNVVPGLTQAAMAMWQMQIPFDLQGAITRAANELGLEWLDDLFGSPETMQRMQLMQQMAVKLGDSKGSLAGAVQNNGNPMAMNIPSVGTEQRQTAQMPVANMQSDLKGDVL